MRLYFDAVSRPSRFEATLSQNLPPVADAGPDQSVPRNTTLTLDGSGSHDANGDPLTYAWSILSAPAGSTATIGNPSAVRPLFTPVLAGMYLIRLIVSDGTAQGADNVTITATLLSVTVPDVVGLLHADAQSAIATAGLAAGTVTQANSATIPAGSVISQSPAAGSQVLLGSAVNLVVSMGPAMVAVPTVLGMTHAEAQGALSGADFLQGLVTTVFSDTVAAGRVIGQMPKGGMIALQGTSVSLVVSDGPAPVFIPPDPATIAPPVDPTVSTSVFDATGFLYTGPDPIQTGVSPETIEGKRVAVLRGNVTAMDNTPLSRVKITVLDHPEFGQTFTRTDGLFDLAVNGGGRLTISYRKTGYLPAHRQIEVLWQKYVVLPDVVLIPYDNQVTTVDLASTQPIQEARGSVMWLSSGSPMPSGRSCPPCILLGPASGVYRSPTSALGIPTSE